MSYMTSSRGGKTGCLVMVRSAIVATLILFFAFAA